MDTQSNLALWCRKYGELKMIQKMIQEEKNKNTKHVEQINRSLGYLISISDEAKPLLKNLINAQPLVSRKILGRLAAALHVIYRIKDGKTPNEDPVQPKIGNVAVTADTPSKKAVAHKEQINRSLGYLISVAVKAKALLKNLIQAEPLINRKVLTQLAAALHIIHKVKLGKEEKDEWNSENRPKADSKN